jgi:hypothetical protein
MTLVFYLQQFTDVMPRDRVFEIAGSICWVALFFGIRLTLFVAAVSERIKSDHLTNIVGSFSFTVAGVLLTNWLLYFAVLYLLGRSIDRLALRGKTHS